jgi:ADP-ribose pyrophosphatase
VDSRLPDQEGLGGPRLLDSETVLTTEWFDVERQTFSHLPDLQGQPYYRVVAPDAVLMLATTSDGNIILVRQFRPAIEEYTLELPAGAVDQGERPEATAARELLEETGFVCKQWDRLGSGRLMASRVNSRQFAFFGSGATLDPSFQKKEAIEVVLARPSQLKRMVLSGEFAQFAAFALFIMADWRMGTSFTASGSD